MMSGMGALQGASSGTPSHDARGEGAPPTDIMVCDENEGI